MIKLIKNYFIRRRRIKIAKLILNHHYLNSTETSGGICRILMNLLVTDKIKGIEEIDSKKDLFKFYLFAYGNDYYKKYHPFWFSLQKFGDEQRKSLLRDYIRYNKENKIY